MISLPLLSFFVSYSFLLSLNVNPIVTGPQRCRKTNTDADWPSHDVWKQALPNVIPRASKAGEPIRPDYRFRAKTATDVQKAVKFASENNVRLTIITTGHDYLGRNDAPSGLALDVSPLKGVRVLPSFTPKSEGVESAIGTETNVISPQPGSQPAVTFGVGMTTQALNSADEILAFPMLQNLLVSLTLAETVESWDFSVLRGSSRKVSSVKAGVSRH
jgi:FAD binding domain-containing protein